MSEQKPRPEQEEWFDLMPVEKQLISYSLGLGVVLLVVLVWISHSFM